MSGQHRIIVGISGATGIALGARALDLFGLEVADTAME
jgi:3-polyprenyl-4-hydroxybenzoate decarboxylase